MFIFENIIKQLNIPTLNKILKENFDLSYNNIICEGMLDKIIAKIIYNELQKDFKDMSAFELGLIDKNGKIIKKPETMSEKNTLDKLKLFIIELKKKLSNDEQRKLISILKNETIRESTTTAGSSHFRQGIDKVQKRKDLDEKDIKFTAKIKGRI